MRNHPTRLTLYSWLSIRDTPSRSKSQTWKNRHIPSSAYGFDQQHVCFESPSHQIDIISFIRQSGGLRSDDLQVGIGENLRTAFKASRDRDITNVLDGLDSVLRGLRNQVVVDPVAPVD